MHKYPFRNSYASVIYCFVTITQRYSVLLFLSVILFINSAYGLQARPKIMKVESGKLVVGRSAQLWVHGKGFNDITSFDALKIGGVNVKVLKYDRKSDRKIILTIRVPRNLKPGVHNITMMVSGPAFTVRLESHIGTANTAKLELMAGKTIIQNGQSDTLVFGSTVQGTPVDQKFQINNQGSETLLLAELNLPDGYQLSGTLPDSVKAGNAANFYVRFTANQPGLYPGAFELKTNDPANGTFVFPVNGSIMAKEKPGYQIIVDGTLYEDEAPANIDFGAIRAGYSFSKNIDIYNSGKIAFALAEPDLPDGISLAETLPATIYPGDSARLNFSVNADSLGTGHDSLVLAFKEFNIPPMIIRFSGTIIEQEADSLLGVTEEILMAVRDTISTQAGENTDTLLAPVNVAELAGGGQNEIPPAAGKINLKFVLFFVLAAAIIIYGIPFLLKTLKVAKFSKAAKANYAGFNLHFKSQKDIGSQQKSTNTQLNSGLELRLKPLFDFGQPVITTGNSTLILSESGTEDTVTDDLKSVEGIGPVISGLLQKEGIRSFADLAGMNSSDLKIILKSAGITIADPTTWPDQAKLAANSRWDELKVLQRRLKGGRIIQNIG